MKPHSPLYILTLTAFLLLPLGCRDIDTHENDDAHNTEPSHEEHSDDHGSGERLGEEHEDEAHDDHAEDLIRMTREQLEQAGVRLEPLGPGIISTHLTLPAEVGLNEDILIHVTPRARGIVTEVTGLLGQTVEQGELLAVLQSPELGEAKITYLQALLAEEISQVELKRQQVISENTAKLLSLLQSKPLPKELQREAAELRIGADKGRLLSAYARLAAAEANMAREHELHEKGLSTQADLLAAQEAHNSSLAEYFAAYEDISFSYTLRLQEAEQNAIIAATAADNAERRLHLLGLSEDEVERIKDEPDTDVARYLLKAPGTGRLVSKHITPGEMISPEKSVYTIANLDTVWLNISVYAQYAGQIREGLPVKVYTGNRVTAGIIDFVSDLMDESTRTVPARVLLDNSDRSWKPGAFVTVRVETDEFHADRVVPVDALQTFEGHEVVFVKTAEGIAPVPVTVGQRSDTFVELLGDTPASGVPVVVTNSFLMKAELGKSAAGHEH